MRLSRMGSFHQTPLSFMRILLRRMRDWRWQVERRAWEIDANGEGHALYTARGPERAYTLVAFAHDLPDEMRSDRVIATAWDATFTLFDGVPTGDDIARLRANVPLQEAGRISERELTLARANRSVRMWDHLVDALAEERQPDGAMLESVGYLMRTTAVYGSGKFGAADRAVICDRPEMQAPFQAEMLTVWLIRAFVADLAEHMARARSEGAVAMTPETRRRLGIGNSTGLGMAPFLVSHPVLLHHWIAARETALARVRGIEGADRWDRFCVLLPRAQRLAEVWTSAHPLQQERLIALRADLSHLADHAATPPPDWNALWLWGEDHLGEEGQEALLSLMLEAHADRVIDLAPRLACDEEAETRIDGTWTVAETRAALQEVYGWALALDWQDPAQDARCWYVSEEKLEPRLGERHEEDIAAWEQPLQPGRDAARFHAALSGWDAGATLAEVLAAHPEHRHIARRVQITRRFPYAEIRDNTIAADMLPLDMLRMKLSFFGATRFDPRSDRWVRINMYQGAPYPGEHLGAADDWGWPP